MMRIYDVIEHRIPNYFKEFVPFSIAMMALILGFLGVYDPKITTTTTPNDSTLAKLENGLAELANLRRVMEARQELSANLQQELREAQTLLVEGQERQISMEKALLQVRQDFKEFNSTLAHVQSPIVRQTLTLVHEELMRTRRALEQEKDRYAVQGEVLAKTQAALSETSASLAEVRAAMAGQAEAQAAMQSDKQQWVERYWDMEKKSNETRAALRRAEQAHAETQQALDQATRQAQLDGIRQSQLRRDLMEARQALDRMRGPSAAATALADLVRKRFADEIQQGELSVRAVGQGVEFSSADMFDFVRVVELGSRSIQTLDRLVEMLQETPSYHVRFQVHTDNIPLRRGSRWPTSWELSTARAAKLARYLIDQGVAPERLSIGGYGDSRPVADNSTPEGQRQNRRVEVNIRPPRQR